MRHTRGRVVEVDDVDDFDRRVAAGARDLAGWRCRGLDLSGRADVLSSCHVAGAMFLGCVLDAGVAADLESRGALVFPTLPDVPVDTYRTSLYTARELFGAAGYAESPDARAYAWAESDLGHDGLLAATLHDHAIDGALAGWVGGRSLVGVMGGHAVRRGSAAYADAARLGWLLGRRFTVATGGGPGAMEAANLGARLVATSEHGLREALTTVAAVPHYDPDVGAWAAAGFRALDDAGAGAGGETLGIPTWHYGHEPPNVFASAIAKYVRNAVREAVLLEVCDAGIVFLPGAAGTVQEVFQDACENYYADPTSVATMVLVGRDHWTEHLPVWPLLRALARDREMEDRVHLVDGVDEAVELVG
ncbi:LOG family protein [Nocardioides coralli]|uniref:LOG family protein n=1 Tax=Nocardioides coralli TaxID=2872154 RepID=UPI001CA3A889|nr:Rossmann fold nucleotide-binding protein [Nocardioides coralli]QZY28110.1 Rossmann fold nucleotide-binding protein [Nocardioides coralli]